MKCPYFRNSPPKCIKMLEQGLEGKLSEFDIKHYCDGNPVFCYFYRLPPTEKEDKTLKQKLSAILQSQ